MLNCQVVTICTYQGGPYVSCFKLWLHHSTRLNSTQLNWTQSRQLSITCEVLNMLRTSQLTENRHVFHRLCSVCFTDCATLKQILSRVSFSLCSDWNHANKRWWKLWINNAWDDAFIKSLVYFLIITPAAAVQFTTKDLQLCMIYEQLLCCIFIILLLSSASLPQHFPGWRPFGRQLCLLWGWWHLLLGFYQCPLYYLPIRGRYGRGGSFVTSLDLSSSNSRPPEHWIRRGTAALLSLDT